MTRFRRTYRQLDMEDAIAGVIPLPMAASSGDAPDRVPLIDPDPPTVPAAGVSAPKAARSRQRARGRKPEPAHD